MPGAPEPDDPPARAVIPRATYRIQLNAGFTLRDATLLVPYLADLGVSHVYCSPCFRARPGSTHGYDVVDHAALNPEIGSTEDLDHFVATLRAHGMGQILDIVPNHVGIMGAENEWWMDVLENGPASRYADFFDIDWQPPNPALANRLLVPVLGDPYGTVLERGELQPRFERDRGSFAVCYHEHRFPLDPATYPWILGRALADVPLHAAPTAQRAELERLTEAFRALPDRDAAPAQSNAQRDSEKDSLQRRLAHLVRTSPTLASSIDAAVVAIAGRPNEPSTFDPLHELLELQAYRLAYWRVSADDINYRRFFDINDLAALRMENEAVFEATHRLVLDLVASGKVDGLRIDHPDGLYDPARYFARLQQRAADVSGSPPSGYRPNRGASPLPLYLVVEKITAGFERLPQHWPVHGTTGYRFANIVNGLFVDARSRAAMDRTYRNFVVDYVDWPDVVYESKTLVLRSSFAAELNVLANQLARISQTDRRTRDFTLSNLRSVLTEVIAWFPVYRTYVAGTPSADDCRYIDWAIARARRRSSIDNPALFEFVRAALVADVAGVAGPVHSQLRAFAMKFQQLTAPVTAKGVEDTALYRFTRLASLNEVGGDPEIFGVSVRQFHADCRRRARDWPHELLATSTHDTKRSEDVRARIDVLSEMPRRWRRALQRWSRMNRGRRRIVDGIPAPGPHAEYLLYQTLLGTWPVESLDYDAFAVYRERIEDYMVKAMREAKRRTAWHNVNVDYEDALRRFIRAALERRETNLFVAEIDAFARMLAPIGCVNSLAVTVCKLTAPGVPDIYQGNELRDLSLVDPDNRRPVDYERRRAALAAIRDACAATQDSSGALAGSLLHGIEDGRAKLYVTWRTLQFRQTRERLFRTGAYLPLQVDGARAAHVLAYARRSGTEVVVIVVPRLSEKLRRGDDGLPLGEDVWSDTAITLPARSDAATFYNCYTGEQVTPSTNGKIARLRIADILSTFPVALLRASSGDDPDRPAHGRSNPRRRTAAGNSDTGAGHA